MKLRAIGIVCGLALTIGLLGYLFLPIVLIGAAVIVYQAVTAAEEPVNHQDFLRKLRQD